MKEIIKKTNEKGFFHLLSTNIATQLYGALAILCVSKILSANEIAYLKLLHSYTSLFIFLGTFGFHTAVLKYCSDTILYNFRFQIAKYCIKITLITSGVSFLIFNILVYFDIILSSYKVTGQTIFYSLIIFFSSLSMVCIGYYQSQKKIKKLALNQFFVRTIFFIFSVLGAYFFGLEGVVFFTVSSYVIGFLMYILLMPKEISFIKDKQLVSKEVKTKVFSIAFFSVAGASCTSLLQNADFYIMDIFGVDQQLLGYYSLSSIFVMALTIIVGTAQSILTPYFSENRKKPSWVWKKMLSYQLIVFLGAVIISIIGYFGVFLLIKFYYGVEYESLNYYYSTIVTRFIAWASFSIVGVALLGMGIVKQGFYIAALLIIPAYIITWYIYHNYGISAIGYSQGLIFLLNSIFVWVLAYIKINHKKEYIDENRKVWNN
ncbi:lipopolysaccharide biosynthesis protein [Zooshikella ganghwensis]|uniref:lipopolysaccharide biosynthesis protein n=1 Tax=Zooshikella ganghwensis TaxID=202772 RepID=UPI000426451D|nr:oligosaccharide flippase family protein [Zooshikella ganghwensis]